MNIRIGTRGSMLALWQAHYVADLLKAGGLETELVTIETRGDKILDVSIAKIGSKGVFTEEIEEQLAQGTIDIAVHSAKDMQSELPEGFSLIAFTEREKVNDVIISHRSDLELDNPDKPLVLGTSSTRRVATLKKYYPHARPVSVRGNLQTRIRKMEEGACDALLLAYAGVHRMGYGSLILRHLPVDEFIPPVGQGSVAIEVHAQLDAQKRERIRQLVNHPLTETRLLAERAYLRRLQGGCSVPVYALAQLGEGDTVSIRGGVISLDGQERIDLSLSGPTAEAERLGTALAEQVLAAGGERILKQIRGQMAH
ncbi:hydroxymethylbilane synthase [Cesiribacter andamanensis]|uniref:Porphobilinogen deaminase n=1 Tax=Cesiribacter andamanensis AMV16 TaxID=1279009 RepID=M7N6F0_9BACT|nr:hydroxymethylbilane synthase [Cesiribacter andamanensis]EMR04198.1 Porphobilinogen deaminase [Cesiribacter andamanensis AMV16]